MTHPAIDRVEPLTRRIRDNPYIPHEPTAKQWAFLLAPEVEVGYGGAAGGGKSEALLMRALMYAEEPGYSALILRTSFQKLKKSGGLIPRSQKWLAETDARYNSQDHKWRFPSGASLEFGYLEHSQDKFQYQSAEYQHIAFDELTEFDRDDYRFLFSRLRRPADSAIPLRMAMATNPIGRGLAWVRERFIEGEDDSRRFIPATLEDNPHISTEEYEQQLARLPPEIADKLRHGDDWSDLGGGSIFERERAEIREVPPAEIERKVRFWDFAATEPSPNNPDPDWLAGVLLAECADGSFGVLDVVRDRLPPDGVEDLISETASKDGEGVPVVLEVEGGSQAKMAVQYIARRVLTGYSVWTRGVSRGKRERAGPFASQWRHRNVWLLRGEWTEDYLDELHDFPDAPHDDQVDASTGSFNWLGSHQGQSQPTSDDDSPDIGYQPGPL